MNISSKSLLVVALATSPVLSSSTSAGAVNSHPLDKSGVFESTKSIRIESIESAPKGVDSASSQKELAAAKICQFNQRVDWTHISSTSAQRAVQSHGNWGNVNCSYSLARVKTQIDKRNFLGAYYAVGTPGVAELPPRNDLGSSARVTGRYVCNGTANNSFRSWTDVDVLGIIDAPNKVYSTARDLACG